MNRRSLLGGLVGLGVLGSGAYVLTREGAEDLEDAEPVEPVTYEPVWSPTDEATVEVPELGRVTVLEFFATDCGICQSKMPDLGELYDDLDTESVQFLSVSIDAVGATIDDDTLVDWWDDYDGRWTMVNESDSDLHLMREFGVGGTPWTVVLDDANRVVSDTPGGTDVDSLHEEIEDLT